MTFLAALRHNRIDAPWFIEGPIDGVSFRTYVEKVLLPVLRPGDTTRSSTIARQSGWEARDNQDGESVSQRGDDCRDDCRAQDFC